MRPVQPTIRSFARPVTSAHVLTIDDGVATRRDQLATEEPMEIRVQGPGQEPVPFAVAMRTPGNDFELAAGLCSTEGIVDSAADLDTIAYCVATDAWGSSRSSSTTS